LEITAAFSESIKQKDFHQSIGLDVNFVQVNHRKSSQVALRGLHYQIQHPQGKLVRVSLGAVFDVAVDLLRLSPNFCKLVREFVFGVFVSVNYFVDTMLLDLG
jgi:dTDP-4-dehydrorhamnose 3,5-epimerase